MPRLVVKKCRFCWATLITNGWLAVVAEASVTIAVKLNVPEAVGVPVRAPDDARFTPGGGLPLTMLQVKGGLSPVAISVAK